MEDAKKILNTKRMTTQWWNTVHFPSRHSAFTKQTKNFDRGYSNCFHNGSILITYWKDNNAVCLEDSDIDSRREAQETTGCNAPAISRKLSCCLVFSMKGSIGKTCCKLSIAFHCGKAPAIKITTTDTNSLSFEKTKGKRNLYLKRFPRKKLKFCAT